LSTRPAPQIPTRSASRGPGLAALRFGYADVAFHLDKGVGPRDPFSFGIQSHGSQTRCLRFAAALTDAPRKTRSRLVASSLAGRDFRPWVTLKGFRCYGRSPFPGLSWRTVYKNGGGSRSRRQFAGNILPANSCQTLPDFCLLHVTAVRSPLRIRSIIMERQIVSFALVAIVSFAAGCAETDIHDEFVNVNDQALQPSSAGIPFMIASVHRVLPTMLCTIKSTCAISPLTPRILTKFLRFRRTHLRSRWGSFGRRLLQGGHKSLLIASFTASRSTYASIGLPEAEKVVGTLCRHRAGKGLAPSLTGLGNLVPGKVVGTFCCTFAGTSEKWLAPFAGSSTFCWQQRSAEPGMRQRQHPQRIVTKFKN
jgi:hypothetical protein